MGAGAGTGTGVGAGVGGSSGKGSKLLPPRPTTAAVVASELTAAATEGVAASQVDMRNLLRSSIKKKDANLDEEKLKRQRAEAALLLQKSIVQDLETQLSDMQLLEQRNLTVRQGLTISRLDLHDKQDVQAEASMLGKDSFAFHDDVAVKESVVKGKQGSVTQNTADKDKKKLPTSVSVAFATITSTLSHPALAGESRLYVSHTEGYKKGMFLVIGSGMNAECRKITGTANILLDHSLEYSHVKGDIVRLFPAIAKSVQKIEKTIVLEYVRGMLLDEMVPQAVALGSQNILIRAMNRSYTQRPMLKHVYNVDRQPAILTGRDGHTVRNSVVLSNSSRALQISDDGRMSTLDFSFSAVVMVSLFMSSVQHLCDSDATECSARLLLRNVAGDAHLRGALHQLAVSTGAPSFASLVERRSNISTTSSSEERTLSWSAYCSFLRPSVLTTAIAVSGMDRDSLLDRHNADALCINFLGKLFQVIDCDNDGSVSSSEVRSSFADLDGTFTDSKAFTQAMERVLGTHTEDHRLSALSYIIVRAEYASIKGTLSGGMLLQGRHLVCELIKTVTLSHETSVRPSDLLRELPTDVLESTILCTNTSVASALESLRGFVTPDQILHAITGRETVFKSSVREEVSLDYEGMNVVQVISDSTKKNMYLLLGDGVVHVMDAQSQRVVAKRRVVWCEPQPLRAMEGSDKFQLWRGGTGMDSEREQGGGRSSERVAKMQMKEQETMRVSTALASFIFSFSGTQATSASSSSSSSSSLAHGVSTTYIAVDAESGLIAVNCSASSGSIIIHEPLTLQRIYRIKAPGKPQIDLHDAVKKIRNGESFQGRVDARMSVGTVSHMVLWARRSLLLCGLHGSNSVHVISLLTGDSVATLVGHTLPLSCLSISTHMGMVFTGSCDCTVRVWIADECIPTRLASFGTFDDPALHALEKKIAQSRVLDAGGRQSIRIVASQICSRLRLTPQWIKGKIVTFSDGSGHHSEPRTGQQSQSVEVVFESGCVQMYDNTVLLRQPLEAFRAPNGPPLWSSPGAPLHLHQEVAIYQIDPYTAACVCAREIGLPHMAPQSFSRIREVLTDFLGVKDETGDLDGVLEIIGLERHCVMSILTLLTRILKHSEKRHSKCDRLLCSNSAPIESVMLCGTSKLLVAIDKEGMCCVWDPCLQRVSLSVGSTACSPSFTGAHPYSLVQRISLFKGLPDQIPSTNTNSNINIKMKSIEESNVSSKKVKAVKYTVAGVDILSVPACLTPSYPIARAVLNAALATDSKFNAADVSVRGYIYVMRDLTTCCVEVSCFNLCMVTLDSPQSFLYGPRMDGTGSDRCLTTMQKLYKNRGDVMRIVYAVTCTHSTVEALAEDLRLYGVLQRGYVTTPSEEIEVVCFERPKGWLEFNRDANDADPTGTGIGKGAGMDMGLIVAMAGDNQVRIAVDFSNDVICIKSSQIVDVLGPFSNPQPTMNEKIGSMDIGSRVIFSLEASSSSNDVIEEDRNVLEVIMASVRCENGGSTFSALIPLLIGRASFPLPARDIDLPECLATAAALTHTHRHIAHTAIGRLSAFSFTCQSARAAWMDAFKVYRVMAWGTGSTISKQPDSGRDMSIVTAFSGLAVSAVSFALDIYLSLSLMRVSPSHPLRTFLDTILGYHGPTLFKTIDTRMDSHSHSPKKKDETAWRASLQSFQAAACMRLGLLPQELFRESESVRMGDLDHLSVTLEKLLSDVQKGGSLSEALGPIIYGTVLAALGGVVEVIGGGGGGSGSIALMAHDAEALFTKLRLKKEARPVDARLTNNYLPDSADSRAALMSRAKKKAELAVLQHLRISLQPLLIAVKEAPLLSITTYEKVLKSFPTRTTPAPDGQYAVIGRKAFPSLITGLKTEVIRALKPHTKKGEVPHTFLSLSYTGRRENGNRHEHAGDASLLSAVSQLSMLLKPLQDDLTVVVRSAPTVGFTGDSGGDLGGMILEWDEAWTPMSKMITKHRGLFRAGQVECFLVIASRILDSLIEIGDRGVMLRGLSPDTVLIDGAGMKIRLLMLPIACNVDQVSDQENPMTNTVLQSYIDACIHEPLRVACIPHLGLHTGAAVDVSGSHWDTWSFGALLFMMAFGRSPLAPSSSSTTSAQPHDASHSDKVEPPTETADSFSSIDSALFNLIMSVLTSSKPRLRSDETLTGVAAEEADQIHLSEALSTALKEVSGSRSLLFKLLSDMSGQSMTSLSKFKSSFCLEGPACGLSERAVALLWEKIMQVLYARLCGGHSAVQALEGRFTRLPKDMTLSVAHAFSTESLSLDLTVLEFGGLVRSLSGDMAQKVKPFPECARKMFKGLFSMIPEIRWYGMFQQVVYIISRCLHSDPCQRPPLRDFRRLALFGIMQNDVAVAEAEREGMTLMSPFLDSDSFVNATFLSPFSSDLIALLAQTSMHLDGDGEGSLKESMDLNEESSLGAFDSRVIESAIERVTGYIGCIEELLSIAVKQANNRHTAVTCDDDGPGLFLASAGADHRWVTAHAVEILYGVLSKDLLPGLAVFVLRYLSTDASQLSADVRFKGSEDKEMDTKGLSVGSRLIVRMSKFLQYVNVCLCSLSRDLVLPALLSEHNSYETDTEELEIFRRILDMRKMAEALYQSCLTTCLMLVTGEEAPLAPWGPSSSALLQAHSSLFPPASHLMGFPVLSTVLGCVWKAHTCKLFEPLLLALVGEEGNGSQRMAIGSDCLLQAERVVESLTIQSSASALLKVEVKGEGTTDVVATRGSAYFSGFFKVFRALCAEESSVGKARERSQAAVVAAVALSLPQVSLRNLQEDGNKGSERRVAAPAATVQESALWQRMQLLLDTRIATRLSLYFDTKEPSLQVALLKACQRALWGCLLVAPEVGLREPYLSVGMDFSSECWARGISDILRVKIEYSEVTMNAIECLRLMACRCEWMRHWGAFDVLSILCFVRQTRGKKMALMRSEASECLRLSTVHRPEGTRAMTDLRIPNAEDIPGIMGPGPLGPLLAEASDMVFGSTLSEQASFTTHLLEWVHFSFPTEIPLGPFVPGFKIPWGQLFNLLCEVSSWIQKTCLTLQINDSDVAARKGKAMLSVDVACKQITAVERVLLYALKSAHTGAIAATMNCIWTAPVHSASDRAGSSGSTSGGGGGLLGCFDQLVTSSTQLDTFLSLKLQCQIVRTLCRLMQYGTQNLLYALLDCGVIRSIARFYEYVVDAVLHVTKMNQLADYNREYKNIFSSVAVSWDALLSLHDKKVIEEIVECRILQRMVENWLSCNHTLSLSGVADAQYNPLAVRSMALSMLRNAIAKVRSTHSISTEGRHDQDDLGFDECVIAEITRWMNTCNSVSREVRAVQAPKPPPGGTKSALVSAANERKTAADVLTVITHAGIHRLDEDMMVMTDTYSISNLSFVM